MATLKDISKATGVSVTQVSRALSGYSDVKADTRRRILEAAEQMGYRPNAIARGLRTGRSGMFALILPADIDPSAKENLFEIVLGLSQELSRQEINLVLHTANPERGLTKAYDEMYLSGWMDGFIVLEPVTNDPCISFLTEKQIPHLVHGHDPTQRHSYVDIDNYTAAVTMAQHLIDLGHRKIAFANGPHERTYALERSAGFADTLSRNSAKWIGRNLSVGAMTQSRGFDFLHKVLALEEPPTAIIASNVMLAAGIYQAAEELGLRIPDDLSVLAHDDGLKNYAAQSLSPIVGGTSSPFADAWKVIAERIKPSVDLPPGEYDESIVPFEFSPGQSTKTAPGKPKN